MTNDDDLAGLEIAIIGLAGRFPGAGNVDELWANLTGGVESISFFSEAELRASGVAAARRADPAYVPAAGVVEEADRFDAGFFGYSPREAALIDPQQRVFLEAAWAALEQAGYAPGTFTASVGVYGGVGVPDYFLQQVLPSLGGAAALDHQAVVANDKDFLATRVAYKLNLHGPALVVQTACSTSLVAVHLACQALLAGECDLALAGGVSIRAEQRQGYLFQEDGIASPDGHCRAFSASARGCVPGNGGGVVVLKRLAHAIEDRDHVHAVIRGSAINNDGARKVGYTAPGVDGQAEVIRAALDVAGVGAGTIGYLEAHGTGTLIGDPIEIAAASRAYRHDTDARGYCAVGSVKTNLGHLDAGAGVTGLIKAALAVEHGVLPPSLHAEPTHPQIDFAASPFFVNSRLRAWPDRLTPRRAGVSAFGIGGTNAHVVLEEPPVVDAGGQDDGSELLVVSAKSAEALEQASSNLAAHLETHPGLSLRDVGHTLRRGRAPFAHRRALVGSSRLDAVAKLRAPLAPAISSGVPSVVLMFPGQGSQYPGMGRGLYRAQPVFRAHIDRCAAILAKTGDCDLRRLLDPAPASDALAAELRNTRVAQPAIFSVSYALARLLMEWGVKPAALIGHSVGEYVAACLAGVMTLEEALWLVSERGRLMSGLPGGSMAAVSLEEAALRPMLTGGLALAATNAPGLCVASGPDDDVSRLTSDLEARGIQVRPLHTSHAFHSPMMDAAVDAFVRQVATIPLRRPALPYLSNVTGTWVTEAQATDPAYYGQQLRHTVRFSECLRTAIELPRVLLVEAGPGRSLTALARRHGIRDGAAVATTRHPDERRSDDDVLLEALGHVWSAGADVAWAAVPSAPGARRVPLPSYPFRRDRHWIERVSPPTVAAKQADIADWFSVPSWERVAPVLASVPSPDELWIVLLDACGVGDELAARLRRRGAAVVTVAAGAEWAPGPDAVTMSIAEPLHYRRLLDAVAGHGRHRLRVVHGWTLDSEANVRPGVEALPGVYARGFDSLLYLAQALGTQAWLQFCQLAVLTSQVHDVVGGEPLWPEKATALGPCRTIPLEYATIDCVSVDLRVGGPSELAGDARADLLIDTLLDRPGDTLAIRGPHRWRQTTMPMRLDPAASLPGFKDGGTYLIAGGLRGIGLALAEQLSRTHRARLLLVGRTPLAELSAPARTGDDVLTALAAFEGAEPGILQHEARAAGLDHEWAPAADRLSTAIALQFFARAGVDPHSAAVFDRDELTARIAVLPRFGRYVDALLRMLAEDGYVHLDGPAVRFLGTPRTAGLPELLDDARRRHPARRPLIDLLGECGQGLNAALTGEAPAVALLFGEGRYEAFQDAVRVVREHSFVPACERLVADLVARVVAGAGHAPLRVLEIGGGEGMLTRALLPLFAKCPVEYHFTDIGRSFVLNAQRRAAADGHSFMRFGTLDISRSPQAQGFEPGTFDLVLAFNVLHATPSVEASLGHARDLLAPGGLLVLQESVRGGRAVDLIWGLTDGWWAFQDQPRRQTSPLLGFDGWTQALGETGFAHVRAYPSNSRVREHADTGVVVGVLPRPAATPGAKHPLVQRIESLGGEVEVVTADVADAAAMSAAVARAEQRFGRLDGVVHAALVLNDGVIQSKTPAAAAAVFRPKVEGTLALKHAVQGRDLDVFVLFSSLVSMMSGAGQVDYCAASSFQDAFAHAEQGRLARRVVSIDWAAWREIGKAFRSAVERGASPDDALPNGMSPAEGFDALARALSSSAPQVLVSPESIEDLKRRRAASDAAGVAAAPAAAGQSREPVRASEPEADGVEGIIAGIWREVLGVRDVGVDANFFDLGGDSLMSLQFIAKAKQAGFRLTNSQVFEYQTVAALAAVAVPLVRDERSSVS